MNVFNVLIQGNFDDIRGDIAIYLLERASSGSCNVWFSGTTGSLSGTQIINHTQGNFTASINQMGWNYTGNNLIINACNNTTPSLSFKNISNEIHPTKNKELLIKIAAEQQQMLRENVGQERMKVTSDNKKHKSTNSLYSLSVIGNLLHISFIDSPY